MRRVVLTFVFLGWLFGGFGKAEEGTSIEATKGPDFKLQTENAAAVERGAKLFASLKLKHPDRPDSGRYTAPPRTIEITAVAELTDNPILAFNLPKPVWKKLSDGERDDLQAYLENQVIEARSSPDKFIWMSKTVPAYYYARKNIQNIKGGAWQINIGVLDYEGYLKDVITARSGPQNRPGTFNFHPPGSF